MINRNAFCWQRHLYLSLSCSIISVLNFKLCKKKQQKKQPNLPIVVILFVKPVMINILNGYHYSVFASCPSAIWQVFLFMNEIGSLFCFLQWRCIFILILLFCFVFFPVWFDKKWLWPQRFFFLYFLHFGCCSFFFLASSICLCHNALFISNLHNKKKSLKVITPMVSVHFPAYVLPLLSPFFLFLNAW